MTVLELDLNAAGLGTGPAVLDEETAGGVTAVCLASSDIGSAFRAGLIACLLRRSNSPFVSTMYDLLESFCMQVPTSKTCLSGLGLCALPDQCRGLVTLWHFCHGSSWLSDVSAGFCLSLLLGRQVEQICG